jgi:hypothetical protein
MVCLQLPSALYSFTPHIKMSIGSLFPCITTTVAETILLTLKVISTFHNYTQYITNSKQQSLSSEATDRSAIQEINHILWYLKVHYRAHKSSLYPYPGHIYYFVGYSLLTLRGSSCSLHHSKSYIWVGRGQQGELTQDPWLEGGPNILFLILKIIVDKQVCENSV